MEAEKQQPKRENNLDNLRNAVNAAKEAEKVLVDSIGKNIYDKITQEIKNAVNYLNDTKRIPITSSDKPESILIKRKTKKNYWDAPKKQLKVANKEPRMMMPLDYQLSSVNLSPTYLDIFKKMEDN